MQAKENWKVEEIGSGEVPDKIYIVREDKAVRYSIAEMHRVNVNNIYDSRKRARLMALAPRLLLACKKLIEWDKSAGDPVLISEACSLARQAVTGNTLGKKVTPREHVWVTVYDDVNGKTIDRYTVAITHEGQPTEWYGMSHNADWPNGVNMWIESIDENFLSGQPIIPSWEWPSGLTAAIKQRIES